MPPCLHGRSEFTTTVPLEGRSLTSCSQTSFLCLASPTPGPQGSCSPPRLPETPHTARPPSQGRSSVVWCLWLSSLETSSRSQATWLRSVSSGSLARGGFGVPSTCRPGLRPQGEAQASLGPSRTGAASWPRSLLLNWPGARAVAARPGWRGGSRGWGAQAESSS